MTMLKISMRKMSKMKNGTIWLIKQIQKVKKAMLLKINLQSRLASIFINTSICRSHDQLQKLLMLLAEEVKLHKNCILHIFFYSSFLIPTKVMETTRRYFHVMVKNAWQHLLLQPALTDTLSLPAKNTINMKDNEIQSWMWNLLTSFVLILLL